MVWFSFIKTNLSSHGEHRTNAISQHEYLHTENLAVASIVKMEEAEKWDFDKDMIFMAFIQGTG